MLYTIFFSVSARYDDFLLTTATLPMPAADKSASINGTVSSIRSPVSADVSVLSEPDAAFTGITSFSSKAQISHFLTFSPFTALVASFTTVHSPRLCLATSAFSPHSHSFQCLSPSKIQLPAPLCSCGNSIHLYV